MEASKAQIKGLGSKLTEEADNSQNDMSKHLADIQKLDDKKEASNEVIKIKESDIKLLQNELDITFEEAKLQLIKHKGNVKDTINEFLNDFRFE